MSYGEIKKAVNSDLSKPLDVLITEKADEVKTATASQTSVNTVTTAIGATNNTGGTATAGSVFAKLNKLLTDWTTARAGKIDNIDTNVGTLINGRVVKSVQYGFVGVTTSTNAGITVNHTSVNLSKSMILLNGAVNNASQYGISIKTRSSTSFLVYSPNSNQNYEFSWQVIEFY